MLRKVSRAMKHFWTLINHSWPASNCTAIDDLWKLPDLFIPFSSVSCLAICQIIAFAENILSIHWFSRLSSAWPADKQITPNDFQLNIVTRPPASGDSPQSNNTKVCCSFRICVNYENYHKMLQRSMESHAVYGPFKPHTFRTRPHRCCLSCQGNLHWSLKESPACRCACI